MNDSKAFGEPFGFTATGRDTKAGIKKLRDRGEWCATVGQMPWIKSSLKRKCLLDSKD